jgi:hypothetical protein
MKLSEDFIIATLSHCIMLCILIGIMKFPAVSVIICYSIGFIIPVVLKYIWIFIKGIILWKELKHF